MCPTKRNYRQSTQKVKNDFSFCVHLCCVHTNILTNPQMMAKECLYLIDRRFFDIDDLQKKSEQSIHWITRQARHYQKSKWTNQKHGRKVSTQQKVLSE